MSNIIYKKVLVLNRGWLPIGTTTVKEALEDMNSSISPKKALKVEYEKDKDGNYDFSKPSEISPLTWDEWIKIEPREFDEDSVRTSKLNIRIPSIIICQFYNKIPTKTFRPTKRNLFERYNGKDYYTGEQISYKDATLDHVHAKSKGGGNSWNNLAITSGKINRLKKDLDVTEFTEKHGYKGQYKLSEPKPVPASVIIKSVLSPDWNIFLKF